MTADISVTASFAIDSFTLTYAAGAHGTISGDASQTRAPTAATAPPVTAVPAAGYHFVKWSDNKTANPRTDLNVTADISVTASFADSLAPVTTQTGADDAWHNGAVAVTLTATDAGSGVATTEYSIDGARLADGDQPSPSTQQGNHTLAYRSTDNAGNVEDTNTVHVKIDLTTPTTTQSGATGRLAAGSGDGHLQGHRCRWVRGGDHAVQDRRWRLADGDKRDGRTRRRPRDRLPLDRHRRQRRASEHSARQGRRARLRSRRRRAPTTSWHTDWVTVTFNASDARLGRGLHGVQGRRRLRLDAGGPPSGSSLLETRADAYDLLPFRRQDRQRRGDPHGHREDRGVSPEDLLPRTTASSTTPRWNTAWQKADVVVTLTAIGDAFGLDFTEYSLDGGENWTRGNEVTIPAPSRPLQRRASHPSLPLA